MPRTRRNRFAQDSFDVNRPGGGADSFAAAQVDLGRPEGRSYARSTIALSKNRHERSWKWLDRIGEVHYAIHRGAKVAGYTKLYCHRVGPDGTIGKRLTSGVGVDIVDGIRSPYGGLRGLVERFILMMKVPGDTYLIRTRDSAGEPNGYDFLSASELDISGLGMAIPGDKERVVRTDGKRQIRRITLPNAENGPLGHVIKPGDFLGRVWRPSGQYVDAPDSPMRALDTECELLYTLTLGIKSKILNRLTLAGLMVLDKSVAKASSAAPTAEENQFHQNAVLNQIINAMTFAVTQPDDPTSAMPILLQTTGETAPKDAVALITTDRELWQTDMELRKELIDRIIMGLDVQPQHVRGIGDSSHWSAWAVSDDERRVSIQPDVEVMCWALTRLILNAELKARNYTGADRLCVWYDLTDANVKTNLAEDARQLDDRGRISAEATRRLSGIEEADAIPDIEYIRWVGVKESNPYLATYGLPEAENIDWEKVAQFAGKKSGPEADSNADPSETSPGKGAPDKPTESDTPKRLRPAG